MYEYVLPGVTVWFANLVMVSSALGATVVAFFFTKGA